MGLVHCSICPPYVEMKKLWSTSLVPIQWAKPHDATKMPQLLCVKLEDPKNFTSQALRRSRAVIHLGFLGGVGCGTVMLKPLAVQGFRIVLQLALECPPKFRQHRTIALGFASLGVAAAIFEVGL